MDERLRNSRRGSARRFQPGLAKDRSMPVAAGPTAYDSETAGTEPSSRTAAWPVTSAGRWSDALGFGGCPVAGEGAVAEHLIAAVLRKLQLNHGRGHAKRLRAGRHDGSRQRGPL